MVNPDESLSLNGLDIMTFSSTDRGVSFMARLKEAYMLAAEYFLKNREIRYLVPTHFSSNFYITGELKNQLNGDERIITVKKQNELLLEL